MKGFPLAAVIFLAAASSQAADQPYDENADARQDVRAGLAAAAQAQVPLIVVFGANWCPDCRVLDLSFKTGRSAALISKDFRVVKVDVGRFDRNVELAESYGVPLRKGIPAVAILSAQGKVLYATRAGELADARRMGDNGIYEFFARVSAAGNPARSPR